MVKIVKRYLLVGKKVLYKSPIDIGPLSSNLHAANGQFLFWRNYSNGYISETGPPQKNFKMLCKFTYIDTFMPIYEPKCAIPIAWKFVEFFDISKIDTWWPTKRPIGDLFKNPN